MSQWRAETPAEVRADFLRMREGTRTAILSCSGDEQRLREWLVWWDKWARGATGFFDAAMTRVFQDEAAQWRSFIFSLLEKCK